jgi:amino-acid N-acetyltransferase
MAGTPPPLVEQEADQGTPAAAGSGRPERADRGKFAAVRPTDLRGILQYVPQFRDRTFVVAVDAAVVADENFGNILMDVAVLWSLRVRTVLVHGASEQMRALAGERGVVPSDFEGSGITDEATLDLAINAANRITHEVLEGLNAADLRAAATNAVIAHPLGILKGVDHLFTGKVERVDVELLQTLLANGIVPVIAPLGMDGEGRTFRINSDAVAVEIAKALSAVKLVFMSTGDGLSVDGRLARQVAVAELADALQKGQVGPEQLSKARHAVAACQAGVPRVHVVNGRVDDGLLAEVFSNEGIGTLVYANEYRQIRRARRGDVRAIEQLIRSSIESEELAPRTRASIERELDDYYIFEVDRNPIACVALHRYPEQRRGELACLYVRPSHENQGIGRTMAQFAEAKARESGFDTLLALSTQAFNWFQAKAGFVEGTPDDLPPERRARYDASGRRSKVLLKKL